MVSHMLLVELILLRLAHCTNMMLMMLMQSGLDRRPQGFCRPIRGSPTAHKP